MAHFPAASAEALLAGLGELGLDPSALRSEVRLPPVTPAALLAQGVWSSLWEAAHRHKKDPHLALRAGLAVPFGAFGLLDYLVGSAASVEGALESLAAHFAVVAAGFFLELRRPDATRLLVTVIVQPGEVGSPLDTEAFTLGVLIGRLRYIAPGVAFSEVATRLKPGVSGPALPSVVRWGAAETRVELPSTATSLQLRTADPLLHKTMSGLAAQLGLGTASSSVELAVRARLRTFLPMGRAEAIAVARSLGMSERTLHRRLAAESRPFQDILDDFRAAESERLLRQGVGFFEISSTLGFSEQSAWARAFRRLRGASPSEWLSRELRRS
jgi:AraC-like DNA-binding protein